MPCAACLYSRTPCPIKHDKKAVPAASSQLCHHITAGFSSHGHGLFAAHVFGRNGWCRGPATSLGVSLFFRRGALSWPHGLRGCLWLSSLCRQPSPILIFCGLNRPRVFAAHRPAAAFWSHCRSYATGWAQGFCWALRGPWARWASALCWAAILPGAPIPSPLKCSMLFPLVNFSGRPCFAPYWRSLVFCCILGIEWCQKRPF